MLKDQPSGVVVLVGLNLLVLCDTPLKSEAVIKEALTQVDSNLGLFRYALGVPVLV